MKRSLDQSPGSGSGVVSAVRAMVWVLLACLASAGLAADGGSVMVPRLPKLSPDYTGLVLPPNRSSNSARCAMT